MRQVRSYRCLAEFSFYFILNYGGLKKSAQGGAIRLAVIPSRVQAIASRLEAIAIRLEATAIRLEALAIGVMTPRLTDARCECSQLGGIHRCSGFIYIR